MYFVVFPFLKVLIYWNWLKLTRLHFKSVQIAVSLLRREISAFGHKVTAYLDISQNLPYFRYFPTLYTWDILHIAIFILSVENTKTLTLFVDIICGTLSFIVVLKSFQLFIHLFFTNKNNLRRLVRNAHLQTAATVVADIGTVAFILTCTSSASAPQNSLKTTAIERP